LRDFESAFSQPTWQKAQVLLAGTLLASGRRTVSAALRHAGLAEATNFSSYHQVLNRAHSFGARARADASFKVWSAPYRAASPQLQDAPQAAAEADDLLFKVGRDA